MRHNPKNLHGRGIVDRDRWDGPIALKADAEDSASEVSLGNPTADADGDPRIRVELAGEPHHHPVVLLRLPWNRYDHAAP